MRVRLRVAVALALGLFACGTSDRAAAPATSSDEAGAPKGPSDIVDGPGKTVATLRGRVLAPEGKIPVAGALVALMAEEPAALDTGLRCDKCISLSSEIPYATAGADGRFELPVSRTGRFFLVVQKGNFRRVRPVDVITGEQDVPSVMTTLPAKQDRAKGDDIPNMAVVAGQWDRIERSLVKLGLGKLVADEVDKASLPFDLYDDPSPSGAKSAGRLLADPALLAQYQIVLLPCRGSSGTTCDDSMPGDPAVASALRGFVEGGGRLYVTDYSYEFVRQLWPGTISWAGASASLGSACEKTAYDAPGVVDDSGLHDWLGAIGHANVTLKESWTTIDGVSEVDGLDTELLPTVVKPRVWMSAKKADGVHPATVSFDQGCGRVLFSTYHTAGAARDPLLPQEKALLYVLLELGVCVEVKPPR